MKNTKKSRRQVVMRRRKIFESVGLTLSVAGFTCLFLFCSTQDGYDLPFPLAIVGLIFLSIGAWMVNFIDKIRQEEEERRYKRYLENHGVRR